MFIIRPVREEDLDQLVALAASIEGGGMTTLPNDRDILAAKIAASTANFACDVEEPGPESYLLVLEDLESGTIGGTAAVFARIGLEKAFYTYALTKSTHVSVELKRHNTYDVLHLVNDYIGFAEVGSLYVSPAFRKPGVGRMLAKSRYLLMASHRNRFPEEVVAEMRGWQDEKGESPFWEALGRHFFGMTFHEADHRSAISNNQFIADLMPKFPVYVNLLPEEAQNVIGRPHDHTVPALKLLEEEGFRYRRHVDIFDAGPCVQVRIDNIRTVREAAISAYAGTFDPDTEKSEEMILSTGTQAGFRSTAAHAQQTQKGLRLESKAAAALGLKPGQELWHAPCRFGEN